MNKHFDCDRCISEHNARNKSATLQQLPFPHECEDNIFNAPNINQRADVCSLTPEELRKFVLQCKSIQNLINSNDDIEGDNFFQHKSTQNIII